MKEFFLKKKYSVLELIFIIIFACIFNQWIAGGYK